MPSLGLVCNLYNEAAALSGWLEAHVGFFDDVRVYHAGPAGAFSNDGTIEILEKWRIPYTRGSIDDGFGVVRTAAIRYSPCEWVMLLDCDERFYHRGQVMTCSGESTPPDEVNTILQSYDFRDLKTLIPNWENVGRLGAKLTVQNGECYDAGAHLRGLLEQHTTLDAIRTIRRHWHDFSFKRPTQNWHTDPDWQMRLVRNRDGIHFEPGTRMHERLVGASNVLSADMTRGPFFDHHHFAFKMMAQENRAHAVAIYDKIHAGEKPPSWEEFKEGKR